MANWDYVLPYEEQAASWLKQQGYAHPKVRAGSRLPTLAEVERAVTILQMPLDGTLCVDCSPDGSRCVMRGNVRLELRLLRKLCEQCGQLWLYPDTGLPAIALDELTDPDAAAEIWEQSCSKADSWQWFHEQLYGHLH